jgi:hypothetical protein
MDLAEVILLKILNLLGNPWFMEILEKEDKFVE